MDKSWMHLPDRLMSPAYARGVNQFLTLAQNNAAGRNRIRCPCRLCCNNLFLPIHDVETHLFIKGINPTYTEWIFHGEEETRPLPEDDDDVESNDANEYIDDMEGMLDDIRAGTSFEVPEDSTTFPTSTSMPEPVSTSSFDKLLEDAQRPLYPGCRKFSKLSFVVKLLHIKTLGHWSIKSFDMLLSLLLAAFPDAVLPQSYQESRSLERGLGFKYHKIHACPNDCILYRNDHANKNSCPKCGCSRWMSDTPGKKLIPQKVLRHFPLKPRLQRLYMSAKIACDMRWHKEKCGSDETTMIHPADSASWKAFDNNHSWFSRDARNVRLGLASDGFNPFNNMAKPYSIWPVILVPYNLPPWLCMKDQFFITSLLIPGPRSPGNDIDIYLQPLLEELLELWEHGVSTYDASTSMTFTLHAALLWTINDFPAYGNLSGWSTKGKLACPTCNENTDSLWLKYGRKHCYMGHRRWLPHDHIWRRRKGLFNGKEDHRGPPNPLSGSEVLHQLAHLRETSFGKHGQKRKRMPDEMNWTKCSVFFKLPYWSKLMLRHNLDVMHTEKNISDNIFGTLINASGKTKDNANARRDLALLGIRNELHLKCEGERFTMPCALYTLHGDEMSKFCEWLADVKFPDGFAANIARCVSVRDCKISGFKSHDNHVFLQRLLPIAVRGFLRNDIALALTELSSFFKELCARTLDINRLEQLQKDIVIILCKLEMIFPPGFFDVMVHLAVHLPHEAILGGPVQYRWMYPFERYLGKFKRYVKNKARPEGSIAEAYIHLECLTFCSMYLEDVETRFNRLDRNVDGGEEETIDGFSIFNQKVRPLGMATTIQLDKKLLNIARWYVLNNCAEIGSYLEEHRDLCSRANPYCADRTHQSEFSTWFKKRVKEQRAINPDGVSADLYALACGSETWVTSYAACIVNGKRFHTKERELRRRTANSGVFVKGDPQSSTEDFYGVIHDIVELHYMGCRHVYLLRCTWCDVGDRRRGIHVDAHITSVNMDRNTYKDDPFVLACQASQCFYIKDLKVKTGNWCVVQKFTNRNVYNIPPRLAMADLNDDEVDDEDAYQENDPSIDYASVQCSFVDGDGGLSRMDVAPAVIDARGVDEVVVHGMLESAFIDDATQGYDSVDGDGNRDISDGEDLSTSEQSVSK